MTRSITILKSRFTKQGGAEKYARLLAGAFHQRGCKVTVLTTDAEGSFPYEVISHPLKSKMSVSKIWEFEGFCNEYLKNHPTDIVFGHDRNTFQTHLRAGSGVHRSFLEHRKQFEPAWLSFRHKLNPLHATLLHIEKKSFEHPELKVLFANSNLVKEEILAHYNVDPQKIQVIHNGVEWANWQESFDAWQKNERFEFLFLGSNFERKGLTALIAALKKIRQADFHLSVVGKDKNQKKFEQMAKGLNVTFHGPQNDVRPFLQRSDCLVIPSFYDPFANVTTEALAMGLFVVSSKTNGGSEVLTPETGYVAQDLSHLTQALEIALNHPKTPERARQIRESVRHLDFSTQLKYYLDACLSPIS